MKTKEIREMTAEQIGKELLSLKREQFNLRVQSATGQGVRPPNEAPRGSVTSSASARVEALLDQMLTELRRRDTDEVEFSVSKLLAGIVQVLAIAVMFLAYLYRTETAETFYGILLFAIFLQLLTISLLIMGRQR